MDAVVALKIVEDILVQLQVMLTDPPEGSSDGRIQMDIIRALEPLRQLASDLRALTVDESIIRWRPYFDPSMSPRALIESYGETDSTEAIIFGRCVLGEIGLPNGSSLVLVAYAEREIEKEEWEESYGVEMISKDGETTLTGSVASLDEGVKRLLRRYVKETS